MPFGGFGRFHAGEAGGNHVAVDLQEPPQQMAKQRMQVFMAFGGFAQTV